MSEPLSGGSTAQDEQTEVIARPSVSAGHFWINPYRSGSDLLVKSRIDPRQNALKGLR
jgi:hypothetical protein